MRRVRVVVAGALVAGALAVVPAQAALPGSGGPLCLPVPPAAHPRPAAALRFGVDPGEAGNPVPVSTQTVAPADPAKELAALRGLRPRHGRLVIRLNRLFWSGGTPLLDQFAAEARRYAADGFDVEVQVRYHPTAAEATQAAAGNLDGWVAYVQRVVNVLGANPRLVSLTITNEVNFDVSPNTSDGAYPGSWPALVDGVEAAAAQIARHGWQHRIAVGFTFAYRFNPATDAALFRYLGAVGGAAFRHALGFVGIDDYPGTVYPPALPPGDSPGAELASAIATMRDCYLPMAGIPASTPLWVTENGFSSAAPQHTAAQQAAAVVSMVDAVRAVGGTYHVTDYRWFNLRDNDSAGHGTFDQDGLLLDTYAPKPAYAAYQRLLRDDGGL